MKENEVIYRRHSDYPVGKDPEYIHLKIIVKDDKERQEMLKASEYLHDFIVGGYQKRWGKYESFGLDSDIMGVNWFMHLYTSPECIEIRPNEKFSGFDKPKNL